MDVPYGAKHYHALPQRGRNPGSLHTEGYRIATAKAFRLTQRTSRRLEFGNRGRIQNLQAASLGDDIEAIFRVLNPSPGKLGPQASIGKKSFEVRCQHCAVALGRKQACDLVQHDLADSAVIETDDRGAHSLGLDEHHAQAFTAAPGT